MKKYGLALGVCLLSVAFNVAYAKENRCGWLVNATPGNWLLVDADGEWTISESESGYSIDDESWGKMPKLSGKEGSPRHGCACLSVDVDKKNENIVKVFRGKKLPLEKCRTDTNLRFEETL